MKLDKVEALPCRELIVVPPEEDRYEKDAELSRIDSELNERFPDYRFIVTTQNSCRSPDTFVLIPILGSVAAEGMSVRLPPPIDELRQIGAFLHEVMTWMPIRLH